MAFPPSSAAKVLLWGNVRFIAGAHFSGTVPLVTSDRSERSWWLSQFSRIDSTKFNMYPLVMTNSLRTGKIHPFLRTVNHLFRLGPSKKHGYVSHNQMVLGGGHPVIRCEGHYGNHNRMGKKNSLSGNGLMNFPQYG